MDPLPWGACVAPQFRRGQFYQGMKPPEPDAHPAGFSGEAASSSAPTKTPIWKPQPIRIANDAQGYSKSQLHRLDMSQEIERLLSMSASDERLSEMQSVPELRRQLRLRNSQSPGSGKMLGKWKRSNMCSALCNLGWPWVWTELSPTCRRSLENGFGKAEQEAQGQGGR